jgi:hypothetical protein
MYMNYSPLLGHQMTSKFYVTKTLIAACMAGAIFIGNASAQTVLPREPARGDASSRSTMYAVKKLDGSTCKKGGVWQIHAGSFKRNIPRSYTCVNDPRK